MALFVKFPGTADNISTDDVNVLDADTAHVSQSLGLWGRGGAISSVTYDTTEPGVIGLSSLRTDSSVAGSGRINTGTTTIAVVASTTYQFSAYLKKGTSASPNIQIGADYYNGTVKGTFTLVDIAWGTDSEKWFTAELTVPAGHDGIIPFIIATSAAGGEQWWYKGGVLREGSDATFVPSLNIVGTLYEETDPPTMPIVYTPGAPLTIGESWAGNGYSYRRYDGANNLAPLVCSFSADDVPVP